MKKTLLFSAIVLLGAIACQKNTPVGPIDEPALDGPTGVISVSVHTPMPETKAAKSSIQDSKINSIQLFVFDANGRLETSRYEASYDGSTPVTITTKTGTKTVYAVLNSQRLNFSTIDKFEGSDSNGTGMAYNDLGENTVTKLIMTGKNTITVNEYDKNKDASATAQSLTIRVKRLAAKVQLDKITVDFRNTALEGGELAVQEIYLVNVVGKSPYGVQSIGTSEAAATTGIPVALPNSMFTAINANWYSMGTLPASLTGIPAVTYDQALGDAYKCTGAEVAGTAKTMDRVFFCYPNRAEAYQEGATPANPVHTSLVIKGRIKSNGTTYIDPAIDKDTWYTFDLPAIEPNKVYQITDIKITMPGADTPGERIITGKTDMSVAVDEWTQTVELKYEF